MARAGGGQTPLRARRSRSETPCSAASAPAIAAEDSLDAWELELAAAGIDLMEARARRRRAARARVRERRLGPRACPARAPCGTGHAPTRPLATSWPPSSPSAASADVERGYSQHGPHLDELEIAVDGRAIRRYGSQGEQRTALLALLFAERRALLEARRNPPLLLLDDVMSELDPDRRELLAARLAEGPGQTLITATEAAHLPAAAARTEIGDAQPAPPPARSGRPMRRPRRSRHEAPANARAAWARR